MNFSLNTVLLAGLTLTLVAMFALGFYWLATNRRSTRTHSPIAPPPVPAATVQRPAFGIGELDEWEALGHYPDHVQYPMHEASVEPPGIPSQFERPEEVAPSPHTPDACRDPHDPIEPLLSAGQSQNRHRPKHAPRVVQRHPNRCSAVPGVCRRASIRATAPAKRVARSAASRALPVVWRQHLPARKAAQLSVRLQAPSVPYSAALPAP